jgi:D-inositol-3-phosphate glycosyltransferase
VVNGVNGFLVPPKDPGAIADCLLEFIRNPGLVRQMGTASRKRAVDIFDEKKILAQTSSVYNSLGAMS